MSAKVRVTPVQMKGLVDLYYNRLQTWSGKTASALIRRGLVAQPTADDSKPALTASGWDMAHAWVQKNARSRT